jgi:FixJ family two-component response regulator
MISLVDDNATARQGIANLLLSLGFEVRAFASAEEFLESGHADVTRCLITDVMLPRLSGLGLQQRLIEDGKLIPIIFLAGFASESLRAKALKAGAVGFLIKPCTEASLIASINKAMGST